MIPQVRWWQLVAGKDGGDGECSQEGDGNTRDGQRWRAAQQMAGDGEMAATTDGQMVRPTSRTLARGRWQGSVSPQAASRYVRLTD